MRVDLPIELVVGAGLLALLGAGAVAGAWAWRRRAARRALQARIEAISADYLQDVILPDGNGGWFHVDFLLLAPGGVLVLDLRDVAGLIFGSEQMTEWTVMQKTRRFTFPNPLGPLYDRMAVVKMIAGDGVGVEGRVVFTERGSFPKGHPPHVSRLDELAEEMPPAAQLDGSPAAAALREAWTRLRAAATPSPLRRR